MHVQLSFMEEGILSGKFNENASTHQCIFSHSQKAVSVFNILLKKSGYLQIP